MENSAAKQHEHSRVDLGRPGGNALVKKGFFKTVLGQFLVPEFWVNLTTIMFAEMARAFFRALGGAIKWYGENKISTPATDAMSASQQTVNTSQPGAVFNRGYTPSSSYQPVSSYPTSSAPSDPSWPGFGPRG
jgi:hypothetical protein